MKKNKEEMNRFQFVEAVDNPVHKDHDEEKEETVTNNTQENEINKKQRNIMNNLYISFQVRVVLLLIIVLTCVSLGCISIACALNSTRKEKVEYMESADVVYKVCVPTEDPYLTNCLDYSNQFLSSDVKKIQVDFDYLARTKSTRELNLTYHITAINRIFDKFDSSKKLYENAEEIVPETNIEYENNQAIKSNTFQIDFEKYNNFVLEYQKDYSYSSEASLELVFWINNGEEEYQTGTMNIPLGAEKFVMYKNFETNKKRVVSMKKEDNSNKSSYLIIVGTVLILLAVFATTHLTKLALKTINKQSKYEKRLNEILTDYDRIIVEARGGYTSNTTKEVVKVTKFEELLDAREMLKKPIIFSKVNNIKSEFIVEDDNKLYKYVLKEVDIENEMSDK
ncbi:MAG: hypothetical protein IJG68_08170 [Bacilli bacterium]|nr:hypothetical protein [Bacilli bacterium]